MFLAYLCFVQHSFQSSQSKNRPENIFSFVYAKKIKLCGKLRADAEEKDLILVVVIMRKRKITIRVRGLVTWEENEVIRITVVLLLVVKMP